MECSKGNWKSFGLSYLQMGHMIEGEASILFPESCLFRWICGRKLLWMLMSDNLPQDASEIGTLVRLIVCFFKCPKIMLVSKVIRQATKPIKSEKLWTCLLPVGSEESGHSVLIKWGQRAWIFHSCLHSHSQFQNTTGQLLRQLPDFLFTASNWKGMRSSHFDAHTGETNLLSLGHL